MSTEDPGENFTVREIPESQPGVTAAARGDTLLEALGYATPPYNPERAENEARVWFVWGVLALFGLTVLVSFAVVLWDSSAYNNLKDLLLFLLPVEATGFGAIASYYFGARVLRD